MDNQGTQVSDNAATQTDAGGQGVVSSDWKTMIKDEGLRASASAGKFKTVDDLLKSYDHLERFVGKEKLPVPTDKDGKEVWDTVYSRLGRPDTPKGYKLPEIKRPEGYPQSDPKELEGLLNKAHELGLNNKQIGALYQTFMEGEIAKYNQYGEQTHQSRLDAETTLRKEWGKSYEERVGKAEQYINSQWNEKAIAKLKTAGLNNDPDVIMALYNSASKMSEDALGGKPSGFAMSPEEALSEIARIKGEAMTNPKHPYINKEHPEHDMMVQKMNKLYQYAHPES